MGWEMEVVKSGSGLGSCWVVLAYIIVNRTFLYFSLLLIDRWKRADKIERGNSFLTMIRDASFSFPSTYTSNLPSLPSSVPSSTTTSTPSYSSSSQPLSPPRDNGNYALNIGPVSLNVDGRVGNTLEAAGEAARDGLKDLFGKVRSRVDGVRLN